MAVNAVDKLQFLSLKFAVLLSITANFVALRKLRLGRVITHQHTKIMLKSVKMFVRYHDLPIFYMAISHGVEFLKGQNFI